MMFWFYIGVAMPVLFGAAGIGLGFVLGDDLISRLGFGAGVGFAGALMGFLVGAIPLTYSQTHYNERTIEAKVLDKDRTGEGDMRVYTDKGVFINADSVWRGKHNSADWWAKWEEGKTYRFDVAGWRLGFTSDFPNIFAWEAVK
jgi:hypothetical protein